MAKDAEVVTKEVAVKVAAGLPSTINFTEDGGQGFEEADASSYAIPFLRILQVTSDQCKKTCAGYIKGAEEGDFYNTVTERVYSSDTPVTVIPCHYIHKYNLWAPDRGGFRGSVSVAEYATMEKNKTEKGEVDEEGNQIQDTREHYVMIVNPDGSVEPALLCLAGTQLKKSKKWMTLMQGICGSQKPMFSQLYNLSSVGESNEKGSWAGIKIDHIGEIQFADQYNAAKQFMQMVRSGTAVVAVGENDGPF
jgi:hypothetical protein